MQRAFATDTHLTRGQRTKPILIVALLFSLMLAMAPAATAQESTPEVEGSPEATPAATPAAGATPTVDADALGTVLMSYDFDEMPPAPMTVRLLRITLAPGASVPMHTHPGPEFDLVESGTLTASIDGTAVVSVDGTQSEVSEPQTLSAESWIMYPDSVGMSLSNEGEEDVVLLSAVILSVGSETESTITYTDGDPTDADFEGVSFVVLGDGLIQQFPDSPATVTVDQLTLAAGEPVPSFSGSALVTKTSGPMAFAATEGQVQVTRTATPQLQPNAIPGQEFTLNDNDAAFFPGGYATIERPESTGELTLTRLLIMPAGELTSSPAVVTVLQAEASADTEAPVAEGDGIGVGAIIALNADTVNVRADATTDSEIVDAFPAGTQFELIDGPIEGESYIWYNVRGVGDLSSVEGWLVTDFMDVIEPAPAGADQPSDGSSGSEDATDEPEAEATPTPEVAPTGGDVEVGAIVATTDENVRIRVEGNAGADILAALPAGTELEVTGGPQDADGFTWYEVSVIDDDVSGWTAVDFLEVVEPAAGE